MAIKKGLVRGIGVNDADYPVARCKYYSRWTNMLLRASGTRRFVKAHPTYAGVSVCDEWLTFSNFKKWMEHQDWRGKHLDKDLLSPEGRIYSPENCIFVSPAVNAFISERGAARGPYKIGAMWHKKKKVFVAKCSNPFTLRGEQIGTYATEDEAHFAWLEKKREHAAALAGIQDDYRISAALIDRYRDYKPNLEECK